MIKTAIIKKYLKELPKNYLTFDIKYTKKELDYLDNFNIIKESTFDHYGNIDNLDDTKLNDFLTKIGTNENISILNKIIHKLGKKVTKAFETKYCWLTIRVTLPSYRFDIPRWHKDGRFFKSDREQLKFLTVLKGPGTLFIKKSNKVNEIYNKYREKKFNEYNKLKEKTILNQEIETKYKKIFAKEFSQKKYKHNQLGSKKGLIFLTGSNKNNLKYGLLHSEPNIDTPRFFISIVPGSETEILELENRPPIRTNILWKDKIKYWKNGEYQVYSGSIKKRFFFETYPCDKNMTNKYKEKFIENDKLEEFKHQDFSSFNDQIKKSNNEYAIAFNNLSNDARLIIPIPQKDKDFTTMKDFCDNASIKQQKEFWKIVAIEIEYMLGTNDKIYISSHGLGVPYFHLRLDKKPKYYNSKEYII